MALIDKKAIAILALVVSLPIISTIAANSTNPALASSFNKNEKITQRNLCTSRASCQNRFLQAPGNSFGLEQQSLGGSWSSFESPSLTSLLGKITMSGIAMSDISNIDPSNAGSVIATIPIDRPVPIAFDSSNDNLYVATYCCEQIVSVISDQTNTVIGNPVPVGKSPLSIAFDSDNGDLYVVNQENNSVSVISGQTNKVVGNRISVGTTPQGIAFDTANGDLYVANGASNDISVISGQTNEVVGTIPVFGSHFGIAFDPANGDLYVTNQENQGSGIPGSVSIISGQTNTVIGNPILVGMRPSGIVFDPANGDLYVTNRDDNTVSAISGQTNTVIGNPIVVGTGPQGVAYDSSNGNLYVTNAGSNSVSVIATTTTSQQSPHTNITSAIDDNNIPVRNGSTTVSTSIHITFTGQPGSNPIAGFQCSIDGGSFSSCTSPFVASNLLAGVKHNFQVLAIDTLGNKDPTPAQFSWTILTPAQGIEQLIQLIKSMGLSQGVQSALIAHLNGALQLLSHKQSKGACIQLNVTKQVQVEVRVHQLNTANALQLIQSTQAIQNALGCKQ